MSTTTGPISLTEKQLAKELGKRLAGNKSVTKIAVKVADGTATEDDFSKLAKILVGDFKSEVVDCLANGYKVTLNRFGRFEPKFTPEKKKGEMVRNVATGEMQPRAETTPAGFKAKASMSSSLAAAFPTLRTKAGKELAALLGPKTASKPVKATPKKSTANGAASPTPRRTSTKTAQRTKTGKKAVV